jgi:uncharacterized membrane protein
MPAVVVVVTLVEKVADAKISLFCFSISPFPSAVHIPNCKISLFYSAGVGAITGGIAGKRVGSFFRRFVLVT